MKKKELQPLLKQIKRTCNELMFHLRMNTKVDVQAYLGEIEDLAQYAFNNYKGDEDESYF